MIATDTADVIGTTAGLRDESRQVRDALSALGRLLGAALAEPPRDLAAFVAAHLRAGSAEVVVVTAVLGRLDWPLVRVAVARLLANARGTDLADDTGTTAPGYGLVTVDVGVDVAAPDDLAAYVPSGEAFEFDAVIRVGWNSSRSEIALHVRRPDQDAAQRALSELIARARAEDNFLRGRTLEARNDGDWTLELVPVAPLTSTRGGVVHTAAVWAEIDANVGGLARNVDALLAAGLGASRGLLVAGPPGVGKTALCRVIAAELPAGTTTVLVQTGVSPGALAQLYASIHLLAPVAVFLDDIDLLAGTRRGGNGGAMLGQFLTGMDGLRPSAQVVTVATTNVTEALDPALLRPGRFDAVIEIGPPDRMGRAEILRRYLAPVAAVDVPALAAATDGATGADLREIVRRAVLEKGRDVTLADLLEIVRSSRWKPQAPTGQYL